MSPARRASAAGPPVLHRAFVALYRCTFRNSMSTPTIACGSRPLSGHLGGASAELIGIGEQAGGECVQVSFGVPKGSRAAAGSGACVHDGPCRSKYTAPALSPKVGSASKQCRWLEQDPNFGRNGLTPSEHARHLVNTPGIEASTPQIGRTHASFGRIAPKLGRNMPRLARNPISSGQNRPEFVNQVGRGGPEGCFGGTMTKTITRSKMSLPFVSAHISLWRLADSSEIVSGAVRQAGPGGCIARAIHHQLTTQKRGVYTTRMFPGWFSCPVLPTRPSPPSCRSGWRAAANSVRRTQAHGLHRCFSSAQGGVTRKVQLGS